MENSEQVNYKDFIQVPLPNATTSLVLGIIAIVFNFCCCVLVVPLIFGIILGVIGLMLSINALKLFADNPENYTIVSYNNAKAAKICSIIGLALGVIFVIYFIVQFSRMTAAEWETIKEIIQEVKDGTFDPNNYKR